MLHRLACLLLILAAAPLLAQADPGAVEGTNWRVEVRPAKEGAEVYAVSKADPSRAAKLCETVAVATTKVSLSPTEDTLLVESGSPSLGTSLRVFGLTEGTEFLEKTQWNVNHAVEKARGRKRKGEPAPARADLHFVGWSADGFAALLRWGPESEGWFVVADFQKNKLGSNLDRVNRRRDTKE